MRVTQSLDQSQFLATVGALEASVSQTQNQISSNLAFTTASQDPVAAGDVNNYDQALAQSQQYVTNSDGAQTRLQTEDSTLSQVQDQLNSLRDLVLEANNSSVSSSDRASIAQQATQIQASLVGLANTQDGNGEYLFSGFATQTQPFTLSGTGATYNGDQGNRQIQIAAGQSVADSDNGEIFNQVKTGNGTFVVSAPTSNTGTGVVGETTVAQPPTYAGGSYSLVFGAAGAYTVTDGTGAQVAAGTYTDGNTLSFGGVQVTLSGTPENGDKFAVASSANQSLFTSVSQIVTALQATGVSTTATTELNNAMATGINNIDQALDQVSNVRTSVGSRLNSITTQQSVASSQQVQLKTNISSLQSLDYATALTTLDQQNTTLSAALQAYTLTQGLSLFKFLQ